MKRTTRVMFKVYKTIESCQTPEQLETAKRMMHNFNAAYGYSYLLAVFYDCKRLALITKY